MNPLNTITGTIVAGFVLALILGLAVNASLDNPKTSAAAAAKEKVKGK